jgi:sigma-B regulation protein RsbU (phosphoserine phosphatase)
VTSVSSPQLPNDRLDLLYRLSQTFNSSLDLDEVLNKVMDEVIAATRAERGFVMLRHPDGTLAFRVARGMDRTAIDQPDFQISRSVAEQVARQGEPMLTSDARRDERFSMRQSVVSLGLRAILCVPVKVKDTVTGIIYVDSRLQAGIFTLADRELLAAIASTAAIAIDNARLYELAVEKGRMERELQVARELQSSLITCETPSMPGWDFSAQWRPAREVAGDFCDFIPLDEERLGVVIADVSDKGMPAALFMALTRSVLRASVDRSPSPADGVAHANHLISADSTGGMFVTLFYGLLSPASAQFTYVNAGHNPPLLYRAAPDSLSHLTRTGMALGVVADAPFEECTLHLRPGDFLFLYTDGVTDATNSQGQRFGVERLQHLILEHRRAHAAAIIASL